MSAVWAFMVFFAAVVAGLWWFTAATTRRVETMLPPAGRFVDLAGGRLHLVDKGQGPPLLLIHGLGGQLNNFNYGLIDQLATSHRVIAVDRPGSGYSVRGPGASAALNAQADVMAALIDTLKLGRTLVVGHSLGGAVALALAQRHPQQVSGLALVAPLTHPPGKMSPAFDGLKISRRWLAWLVARTLALPAAMVTRDKVLAMVFGPDEVPDDFATRGGGALSVRPSHFEAACADMAAVPHDLPGIVDRYPGMQLPVGVLYGRGDQLLDPAEQGQALVDKLPGASLTVVEGGHMLPVTAPDLTARFIIEQAARAGS